MNTKGVLIQREQRTMHDKPIRMRMVIDKEIEEDAAILNLAKGQAGKFPGEELTAKKLNLPA